jgi:hypothetical protein
MTEIWTEDAKDAWFRTHEWTDLFAPEAPISHIVTFRPDIRIRVLVPPWADAEAWLEAAHRGWNDWLAAGGEIWIEPAGEALIDVQVLVSIADIDEVRRGQARTNGRTNDADPDRATAAQLALPVDDDLSAALWALEETLLALVDLVADARPAADTAGRLAALVDPDRSDAVRPALGLTEVIPLAFPLLPAQTLTNSWPWPPASSPRTPQTMWPRRWRRWPRRPVPGTYRPSRLTPKASFDQRSAGSSP